MAYTLAEPVSITTGTNVFFYQTENLAAPNTDKWFSIATADGVTYKKAIGALGDTDSAAVITVFDETSDPIYVQVVGTPAFTILDGGGFAVIVNTADATLSSTVLQYIRFNADGSVAAGPVRLTGIGLSNNTQFGKPSYDGDNVLLPVLETDSPVTQYYFRVFKLNTSGSITDTDTIDSCLVTDPTYNALSQVSISRFPAGEWLLRWFRNYISGGTTGFYFQRFASGAALGAAGLLTSNPGLYRNNIYQQVASFEGNSLGPSTEDYYQYTPDGATSVVNTLNNYDMVEDTNGFALIGGDRFWSFETTYVDPSGFWHPVVYEYDLDTGGIITSFNVGPSVYTEDLDGNSADGLMLTSTLYIVLFTNSNATEWFYQLATGTAPPVTADASRYLTPIGAIVLACAPCAPLTYDDEGWRRDYLG